MECTPARAARRLRAVPAARVAGARAASDRRASAVGVALRGLGEGAQQVERDREDRRRGVVRARRDLEQRLQVAQLERRRVARQHLGRLGELLGRLELALGADDLGAPLALGLGLTGHGPLHALRQLDVLDLDDRDLDAPRLRLLVDDALQDLVDLVALGEQLVERVLTEHGAQGGLRDLARAHEVVLDRDDGRARIDDAEVDDGRDTYGDVVLGDDVLRGHLQRHDPQVDAHDPVDHGDQQEETRSGGAALEPSETEDHTSLVLAQHLDGRREHEHEQHEQDYDNADDDVHLTPLAGVGAP